MKLWRKKAQDFNPIWHGRFLNRQLLGGGGGDEGSPS